MASHLQPTAPLAPRVLLPGDPGRAMRLAQQLIDGPKMFNHHRGLWGYSGPARADGEPLTVQASGIGAPSLAAVLADLVDLGASRLVRVGTCRALTPAVAGGTAYAAVRAVPTDGVSRALGAGPDRPASPDPRMTSVLGLPAATVLGTDLLEPPAERHGATVHDLSTPALFVLAERWGVRAAAALLVVSGPADPADEAALGARGFAALGA